MSNKLNKSNKNEKKNQTLPIVAGALVLLLVVVLVLTSKQGTKGTDKEADTAGDNVADVTSTVDYEVNDEGNLVIQTAGVTKDASFIDYDADGTAQQIFVVKASDDTIRVAFNTCQVCNGSPRAYFTMESGNFMCQNCGNRYSVDQVGKERGGCNPIPITEDDYEVVDDTIVVSKDFMFEYADAFTNWKKFN